MFFCGKLLSQASVLALELADVAFITGRVNKGCATRRRVHLKAPHHFLVHLLLLLNPHLEVLDLELKVLILLLKDGLLLRKFSFPGFQLNCR